MNRHELTAPAVLSHEAAFLSPLAIDAAVHRALDEDFGRAGDITSMATLPDDITAHAIMVARQSGVVSGLALAAATFRALMDRNFLSYASYVIRDRAIPNLADGLKPVQRRILWALKRSDDGRFTKVANVVGDTM